MACLALDHIFREFKVRKVIGEALGFNQASISYHKKLGFSQEGHFVKQVLKNGEYHDVVSFAIFEEEWQQAKPALEQKYFEDAI
jgi:RimJ/RimL family protein N-acetyltransferase